MSVSQVGESACIAFVLGCLYYNGYIPTSIIEILGYCTAMGTFTAPPLYDRNDRDNRLSLPPAPRSSLLNDACKTSTCM